MNKKYCDGVNLNIAFKDGKITQLNGLFYLRGDSWKPTYVDLMEELEVVNIIRIQNPNIINVYSWDCNMHVEYFTSIMIINDLLIIEI